MCARCVGRVQVYGTEVVSVARHIHSTIRTHVKSRFEATGKVLVVFAGGAARTPSVGDGHWELGHQSVVCRDLSISRAQMAPFWWQRTCHALPAQFLVIMWSVLNSAMMACQQSARVVGRTTDRSEDFKKTNQPLWMTFHPARLAKMGPYWLQTSTAWDW